MAKSKEAKKGKSKDEPKGKKAKAKPEKVKKPAKAEKEVKEKKSKKEKPAFDMNAFMDSTLDTIAKRQGFESSGLEVSPPMSTGMLALDVMTGGGIRPCMLTAAGNEQCAKTTVALTAMGSAINENIPLIAFIDYEGSTKNSKPYVHSILKGLGVKLSMDEVFGKRAKDGKWEIAPRVRYRAETILERFYEWLGSILRELPDKRFVENDWWLVFEDTKKNKMNLADAKDESMTRKYGNGIWVKAPDGKIQGIVFLDSYTAMNPAAKDEENISNQLSVKASAFSKQLERIKGRMAEKMVTVYGLNHLRDNPMAMFGPKETEKGGKALQQFSDVRFRQTSRALSAAPFSPKAGKKTYDEQEKSVEFEGTDTYRYVHVKAIKNKLWTPGREAILRIWVEDGSGVARGMCPVFDTMYYLRETGQISGQRKGFKLDLDGHGKAKKPIPWEVFKKWILGDKETMKKISVALGYKPLNLRKYCFKQIVNGSAERMYVETQSARRGSGGDDDGDE